MSDVARKTRVLIVDDERVIADTLALILNQNGFAARVAYNGEEALRQTHAEPPEILLADAILSGVDGVQVAVEISRLAPNCRVLIISGQSVDRRALQAAGADQHGFEILLKPVHPQKLVQILHRSAGAS